jgi:hypothetical protein
VITDFNSPNQTFVSSYEAEENLLLVERIFMICSITISDLKRQTHEIFVVEKTVDFLAMLSPRHFRFP